MGQFLLLHALMTIKEHVSSLRNSCLLSKPRNQLLHKISEKTKAVAEVLKNIPTVNTRLSQTGDQVVNFSDEEFRDSAVSLIQDVGGGMIENKEKAVNVYKEVDVIDEVLKRMFPY